VKKFFFLFLACSLCASPFEEILELFETRAEDTVDLWIQKEKERWEFDERFESKHLEAWPLFEKAGLIFEVAPRKGHYDYALVHGASLGTVKRRIAYLSELWERGIRFDRIVLLTGERPLQDGERMICGLEMEWEMVFWLYSHSDLPKDIPTLLINARGREKEGRWIRPKTGDTIWEWMKTGPKPGSCLAISNQPYVLYQDAVMASLLPKSFEIETVGPAASKSTSVALILDTIAKTLAATDGYYSRIVNLGP
jgi:hypothetical protein